MAANSPPPRTRSARRTLLSLLLIPMLSLAGLWGLTASMAVGNVIRYEHYATIVTTVGPGVTGLQETLPVESAASMAWLAGGRRPGLVRAVLTAARQGTDRYVPQLRGEVMQVRGLLGAKAAALMDTFLADLAGLGRIRAAVDSGGYDPVAAYNAYSAISTAEIQSFQNASSPSDPELGLMAQSALAESRAQDATGGVISLIEAAIMAHGVMTAPERVLFAQVVGQQNLEIGDTFSLANPALRAVYQRVYDLPAYQELQAIETRIEDSPASRPIPVDAAAFQLTAQAIQKAVESNGAQIPVVLSAQSARLRDSTVTQLALAVGLGLVAVVTSVFVMVRFGRRLRVELSNLYDSAREMAGERLPRLVGQLRRGEDVDVEAESPPLKPSRITEIAIVAGALATVRRAALEAAVGQASLRKGVNQVFVSLSLRSQSLLHRQLGMLDDMERATSDPAVLADLFRLDHLTTRMRRHAEGLLILAGATPGRGWRDPVPVADVLQAAVAEIEDYVRVDVIAESADAVAGPAVNDVIHLLAELVENATAFSPPSTRVMVSGGIVGRGFAVEIEDRGLGMAPEALAAVNEQLASPPEFDLANSDQLGLFLAGQLAARHGIKVTLRQSPYGGTTAIVLLPAQIITSGPGASTWFGPAGSPALPSAAVTGPAREAGPAGDLDRGLAFGMTGRHRLAPAGSAADDGHAGQGQGAEQVAGSELPPAVTEPWFPGLLPSAADQPERPAPGLAPAGSPAAATAATSRSGGAYRGLPRRVRRASLAPQLGGLPGAAPAAVPRQADGPAGRAPEQIGSLMSAMQDGWQRGRQDDLDLPGAGLDVPGGWPAGPSGGEAGSDDREGQA